MSELSHVPDRYYQAIPEITPVQTAAVHRLLADEPDAVMLEQMLLGEVVSTEPRRLQDSIERESSLRTRRVAELFRAGMTRSEIRDELGISPTTVTTHLQRAGLADRRSA